MIAFPHCKINLGLHVMARRADGYHDIETCFYPVPWTDILEIIPATQTQLFVSGNSIPGNIDDNLCLKAYELLKKDFELPPVEVHLHKILPTGAGLGGGSSDGTFVLKLLNNIFNLKLTADELNVYAAKLGSDCPFFINDQPAMGTGRGDKLELIGLTLSGKWLVIAKPKVHVSTSEAYAGVTPKPSALSVKEILESKPLHLWRQFLKNDFEESVFKKHPVIETMKNDLYSRGATYASMTGSGAAVYGIFDHQIELPSGFADIPHWSGLL